MGRLYCLCTVLFLACSGLPAAAGQQAVGAPYLCYGCGRDSIYGLTNLIDYLEANPDVDDAYKGPIITWARAEILRLRAVLGPRPQFSPVPCCYRRRPLYIR
jgi:hypothetical protein